VRFTSVAQQLGEGLEVIFQAVGLLLQTSEMNPDFRDESAELSGFTKRDLPNA